jgi:hypothetical protein
MRDLMESREYPLVATKARQHPKVATKASRMAMIITMDLLDTKVSSFT